MQIQAKIRGILYYRGGKPGSNYPYLEPGSGPSSDYKSLVKMHVQIAGNVINMESSFASGLVLLQLLFQCWLGMKNTRN